jgi:serine protease Do
MRKFRLVPGLTVLFLLLLAFPHDSSALGFDAEALYDAVYVVYSGDSLGSGFAIDKDHIVTNAHVVKDADQVIVKNYSGDIISAFVVLFNDEMDIAVLSADASFPSALTIGSGSETEIGDDVYAIGAPSDLEYTLTKGIISRNDRTIGGREYIQANIALNSGNSGGPLLNDKGEVIGVNTMKMTDSEGIGFAIPISNVTDYMLSNEIKPGQPGTEYEPPAEGGDIKPGASRPPEETTPDIPLQKDAPEGIGGSPAAAFVPYVFLAVMLPVSAAVISIVYRANKTKTKNYDPKERTDFDIDIKDRDR